MHPITNNNQAMPNNKQDLKSSFTMNLSDTADAIQPFHVMEIMRLADDLEQKGVNVIHLEMGEPSFPTPAPIVEAGQRALAGGKTHYTRAIGIDPLRKAIAAYYKTQMNCDIDWQRVVVSAGASAGLLNVLTLLINRNDKVLVTDPGYPCYPNYISMIGGIAEYVKLEESAGFKLSPEKVQAHWDDKTRAALIASPANPTGAVLSLPELAAIAEKVKDLSGALIVDEIYQGLNYQGFDETSDIEAGSGRDLSKAVSASSVLQIEPDAIVVNSFSKYFGMTGWRIGWAILPSHLVSGFEKIAQNLTISPTTISQYAALAAFSPETISIANSQRQAFELRRNFLVSELRDLGFGISKVPDGAFYIYASIDRFIGEGLGVKDSYEFCQRLLVEKGVAITPGLDFSPSEASRFVRFSYTPDLPQIEEAVSRIRSFLE